MQKRFDRQLDKLISRAKIEREEKDSPISILAGISGGPDSVCLLNLLMKCNLNISLSIAHMNFSLRGEDSDGDELFVRELAKFYGIKCYVKNVDTMAYAKSHAISIEMAARDLRYKWFNQLISEHNIDYLAIAHNANDNAETLILNLVRGTGLRGLCSIKSNDKIIRPMIIFSRDQIEKYNHENNIKSRIDKTNFDSEFSRNRIRNEVIPQLSIINPSVIETLNNDIENFSIAYDILSNLIRDKISKFKVVENYNNLGRVGICKEILDKKMSCMFNRYA
jgi:tRNA(Ile)-lysidine synthetase, N-terminal domain